MKKSYLMLAATATILASCAETDKINTDLKDTTEPKVIGFSSYSENATKGDASVASNLEFYHNTFAVYGTKQSKNDATDIQYLFGGAATAAGVQDGVTCSYLDPAKPSVLGDWRYDDPRFWDKQADFDFIAYAPAASLIRYYYSAANALPGATGNEFKTTGTYTLEGTNIQSTPTTAEKVKGFTVEANGDLDLMVAGHVGQLNGASYRDFVNLQFRHILSKFNVKVLKGEGLNGVIVTVKEVTITGLDDSGDYESSGYNPGIATGWTSSVDDANYALSYVDATGKRLNSGSYSATTPKVFTPGAPYYFIESLIIPQGIADDQVEVTVKYSIKNNEDAAEQNFTNKFDLYDLENLRVLNEGYNYTLTCTVQTEMIKFDATASAWDNVNASKDIIAQGE